MKKFHVIPLCISFMYVNVALCQTPDTTRVISAVKLDSLTYLPYESNIDTSLFYNHFYNPALKNNLSVTFLGNTGQPYVNNNFFIRNKFQPFLFHSSVSGYFHTPDNILHFNTRKPFTDITYVSSGSRANSEQILNVLHTQNINPNTNFGIRYNAISSRGIYLNQDSRGNLLSLFGSYNKDNYSIYGSVYSNKLTYQENGGLRNVDEFLEHKANDPLAYAMNFTDAQSTARRTTFFLTHSLKNMKTTNDSAGANIFLPKGTGIHHTFNYSRFYRTYFDLIPPGDTVKFYTDSFYRINQANDSAFMHFIDNTIQFSIIDPGENIALSAGARHQFQKFNFLHPYWTMIMEDDEDRDTVIGNIHSVNYNNLSLTGNIIINTPGFKAVINAEYFLSGYRQNDISSNILINRIFRNSAATLGFGGVFNLYEPDFFMKSYGSSHFMWYNEFNKTLNANIFVHFTSKNGMIYAEARTGMLNNYIYFNTSAIPEMNDDQLYITTITLKTAFRWGAFNHIHDIMVQKASDNEVVNIPLAAYRNSTYYEKYLFHKALLIQAGADFYYNTSYYSDAFMPALGVFHHQDVMKTGNYPFLNGFLNWQIKRTRFFLKYTNILAGIAGFNYFTAYAYPMNERSLKFGVTWTFYD